MSTEVFLKFISFMDDMCLMVIDVETVTVVHEYTVSGVVFAVKFRCDSDGKLRRVWVIQ
jgi:hypothetical protein